MKNGKSVIYVGPELAFQGLTGRLVDAIDPATHKSRLHFQPESDAVRPVPCDLADVEIVEPGPRPRDA
jgi:hypothetical protein